MISMDIIEHWVTKYKNSYVHSVESQNVPDDMIDFNVEQFKIFVTTNVDNLIKYEKYLNEWCSRPTHKSTISKILFPICGVNLGAVNISRNNK